MALGGAAERGNDGAGPGGPSRDHFGRETGGDMAQPDAVFIFIGTYPTRQEHEPTTTW